MVVAGHYLAAEAGFAVLESGGNAVDAGVAAGIALGVVQSDIVNVAGVAPIMLYLAETREVVTVSGLGVWPRAASLDLFAREHGGRIPRGILRTVVPAAPHAWITALERWGTMSFGEVAAAAVRLAGEGFVMYPLMAEIIETFVDGYRTWPSNAAIYLPGDRPPAVGSPFVQEDLARTLHHMADEEAAAAGRGREAGLRAARDAFYRGDIARTIVDYHRGNGGLMTAEDLAGYESLIERPARRRFGDWQVYTCGPWCQGPVLLQMLALLGGFDLKELGHNSPAYAHVLTEAMKLAFADRERYYGDPRFVEVPLETLVSDAYAAERRRLIRHDAAWPEMPPPGVIDGVGPASLPPAADGAVKPSPDTSYVCVVDRHGNAFSATPSDISSDAPVIPGTGLVPSSRGSQSWAVPGHAACVAPGKRPRLTPSPGFAIHDGQVLMPFGTPGGDVQAQAMLQVFLNHAVFGMDLQPAIEAPRFATYSFPDSFEPHDYHPGKLLVEDRFDAGMAAALTGLGHAVEPWPAWTWRAGAVCAIAADRTKGVLAAGADPRRPAYALGW
jgi:gamma-glutamyltranspeptidase/glutathione hydrolase